MQRMRESVKPVLCSRTLKVSTALATMHVSNRRSPSRSSSDNKDAAAITFSFRESFSSCMRRCYNSGDPDILSLRAQTHAQPALSGERIQILPSRNEEDPTSL